LLSDDDDDDDDDVNQSGFEYSAAKFECAE
jgi:hypothetical protein